jgi:long-chain acyl-CoA synthetase
MRQPDRGAPGSREGSWDFGIETTLIRILAANAQAFPQRVAMREKDRGIWQQISWQQVLDSVLGCAAGLQSLGLRRG